MRTDTNPYGVVCATLYGVFIYIYIYIMLIFIYIPIGSMYGIFTYIYHKKQKNKMKANIPVPWILWGMFTIDI